MDRSIVQALHGLIPALSGPLPPELVNLATSLLAQSRNRASSLRAEEEIARTYACANIACERLKQRLSLPKIQPRPPCPPRVYQKLYRHLETALPASAKSSSHPYRQENPVATPSSTPRKSSAPTKSSSHLENRTTAKSRRGISRSASKDELPNWLMPVTRQLCRRLEAPAAPHHIFAGLSSILAHLKDADGRENELLDIKIPALMISIFFFVAPRLAGEEIQPEQLQHQMSVSLALMQELIEQGVELQPLDELDVRNHMRQIALCKWVDMDWFRNIQLGSGTGRGSEFASATSDVPAEGEDADDVVLSLGRNIGREPSESSVEYLRPGLGTMIQESIDYGSDEHCRAYEEWEAHFRFRMQEQEKQQIS